MNDKGEKEVRRSGRRHTAFTLAFPRNNFRCSALSPLWGRMTEKQHSRKGPSETHPVIVSMGAKAHGDLMCETKKNDDQDALR